MSGAQTFTVKDSDGATSFQIVKNNQVLISKPIGFVSPEPTPTPSPTPVVTPSPSPTPVATPTPSPTPVPTYKSLKEVVKLIPDSGFKAAPLLARLVLNVEASAVQLLIEKKKYSEAIALLKLVKIELQLILKDKYSVTGQQLTKQRAIEEVDKIIAAFQVLNKNRR